MDVYPKYVSVILDVSVDKALDYGVPPPFADSIRKGMRVEVPVRGRPTKGYVYAVKEKPDFPKVLPITRPVSEQELISEELFALALWMAKYYCAPLSQVLKILVPSSVRKATQRKQQLFVMRAKTRDELCKACETLRGRSLVQAAVLDTMLKATKGMLLSELLETTGASRSAVDALAKKGLLSLDIVRIDRSPLVDEEYFRTQPKELNASQKEAFDKIAKTIETNRFETHLLHGVTGSGKTEIYLQAIELALQKGKGAIMLVPEISLTPQTIERFKSRFDAKIAVLHHRLSHGERHEEWKMIREGKAKIVIGPRSAVFSPVQNLGAIVVDEEHEASYKQSEESPCYNARDVAVMRGKMTNCCVILGSATPSLESYSNAKQGKYTLSELHVRAEASQRPRVAIIDMTREYEKAKGFTNFSEALLDGIKKRHAVGEQTILFLNRRGYHTTLFCQACRQTVRCQHCDMALAFHSGEKKLACHLCGYTLSPPPRECPTCKADNPMKFRGAGTELLEKSLLAILPEVRVVRLDADTTRHKGSHQKLLRSFGTGKADVLIGTQMVAKGLHFPEVTLVGIINCDMGLNIPDFRASETVFQLITQVAGRAGRGAVPGEVILQTCMPENSTILHAARQDYAGFYTEEIASREMFGFSPFSRMVKIVFSGKNEANTATAAERLRQGMLRLMPQDYELFSAAPCGYSKVKDHFRFQFVVRGPDIIAINKALASAQTAVKIPSSVKVLVDVNPLSIF